MIYNIDRNLKNIGYRANKPACINIKDVIFDEIYNLNNSDILEYCVNNYNLSNMLKNEINELIDNIFDCVELPEIYIKDIIYKLINELNNITGKNLKYAMWLTSKKVAIEYYNDGSTDNIYKYSVSNVILSDLEDDGLLYAYENIPEPINENKNNKFMNKKILYESIMKHVAKQVKKALNENNDISFDEDEDFSEAAIELANFLECEPEELDYINSNTYRWGDEEYLIYETESEARAAAYESIQTLIDDIGIGEAFDKNLILGYIDTDQLEDFRKEDTETYCDEIEKEESDLIYDNLLDELLAEGEYEDEDEYIKSFSEKELQFELNYYECDTVDELIDILRKTPSDKHMSRLREEMINNNCETKEEYVDKLCNDDDVIRWFTNNFGEKELYNYCIENNCIDVDGLIDNILDNDGFGNTLASYDGNEYTTDNDWLVYRIS